MKKKEIKVKELQKKSAFGIRQTAPAVLCLIGIRIIFELILRYGEE